MSLGEWWYKADFKNLAVMGVNIAHFSGSVAVRRRLAYKTTLPNTGDKGKMKLAEKRRHRRYRRRAARIVLKEIPA